MNKISNHKWIIGPLIFLLGISLFTSPDILLTLGDDGTGDGSGSADTWNVMTSAGKSYTFTTTGKGLEWANQAISACTANPGGVVAIVQNSTGVKISGIAGA